MSLSKNSHDWDIDIIPEGAANINALISELKSRL